MNHIPEPTPSLRVSPLPRLGAGNRWRTEAMRSYSQPVLLWFTRGQGRITIAGATHGYGAHNMVFLPAGTMHGFEMSGQVFGSAVFMPRDPALMLPEEPMHLRFRDAPVQAELTTIIDNIQRELDRELPGKDRALMHHAGLLSVWIERQAELAPDCAMHKDASRRLAAAFTSLVEEHYQSGKQVSEFAADLGVTPTHLTRACNIACGRPASAILADRVHFEARRRLAETRQPIKRIAEDLGFSSAAYFTRAFQKQTGATPSEFRRDA